MKPTRVFFLFCLIGGSFSWSKLSAAPSKYYIPYTTTLGQYGYEFSLYGDYSETLNLWDSRGQSFSLESGEYYRRTNAGLIGRYGVTKRWQLEAGAQYRMNQSRQAGPQNLVDRSASGLERVYLGTIFSLGEAGGIFYSLEGQAATRTFSNTIVPSGQLGSLALGDEGTFVSAGGAISTKLASTAILSARLHYRNPAEDLSNEVYAQTEIAFLVRRAAFFAGVEKLWSLQQDVFTDNPAAKPSVGEGITQTINSVNREYLRAFGGVSFGIGERARLKLQVGHDVQGAFWDQSISGLVALSFRFEPNQRLLAKEKKRRRFKTYALEGEITRVLSTRFVQINLGKQDDVSVGQRFDLYASDFAGEDILVATARVVQAGLTEARLKVREYFARKVLAVGMIARARL